MNAAQLVRFMPEALALDIERSMMKRGGQGWDGEWRITILFDGFERLAESRLDDLNGGCEISVGHVAQL